MLSLTLLYLLLLSIPAFSAPSSNLYLTKCSTSGPKKAIASLWAWSWTSVQAECSFLAKAGYGYVQVSPPAEHITGPQWWTDYQIVSYQIKSKRGSRAEFQAMAHACRAVGVKVIVDIVINHMSGIDSALDFHHCGLTPNDAIVDFGNKAQVELCQLVNLADLNTESEYVRQRLAKHLNDVLSLGVDGFRIDAAKRRFRFAYGLLDAFQHSGISSLTNLNNRGWLASGQANVFVANHDTERGGSSLSYKSGNNMYTLGHVFLLAFPYGTPTVHSGFSFSDTNVGAPSGGACSGNGPKGAWVCEHRLTPVVGMVGFFNAVGSAPLRDVFTTSNHQHLAFGRGSSGYVAINNSGSVWKATFKTSLPAGTYCDVVSGAKVSKHCTASRITVAHGSFTYTVPAHQAIAIHIGAKV
ncbi:glycoside hydrolase family 13 protein [Hydnum rufescens UP504]|uniref:alpha-amylase n=1 Tax=Hydnum rufescens UP504 TaxID=1448309 RepID=A0A9P6AUB0_9AGAM|nr:glycoside hydrolase family 13 protein [Hydnum rufescens UP504]